MANNTPKTPNPNGKYRLVPTIKLKIFSPKRKGISVYNEINNRLIDADNTEKNILNNLSPHLLFGNFRQINSSSSLKQQGILLIYLKFKLSNNRI